MSIGIIKFKTVMVEETVMSRFLNSTETPETPETVRSVHSVGSEYFDSLGSPGLPETPRTPQTPRTPATPGTPRILRNHEAPDAPLISLKIPPSSKSVKSPEHSESPRSPKTLKLTESSETIRAIGSPESPDSPKSSGHLESSRSLKSSGRHESPPGYSEVHKDPVIDEEALWDVDGMEYYGAHPGLVILDSYRLISKFEYGVSLTVWVAENIQMNGDTTPRPHVMIKFYRSGVNEVRAGTASANQDVTRTTGAHRYLRTPLRIMLVPGPTGVKPFYAVIYDPLREPLETVLSRLDREDLSAGMLRLFKDYFRQILTGLEYLHTKCHAVHTDLREDNLMLTVEHPSVIERFIHDERTNPVIPKHNRELPFNEANNDIGPYDPRHFFKMIPIIKGLEKAQVISEGTEFINPIQFDNYRAPEVILGTGWTYSADIWNFGVLVWRLLSGRHLFQNVETPDDYSEMHHLAEMIALLGPIPPLVAEREREMRFLAWNKEIYRAMKAHSNAVGYFGGPFIYEDGSFMREDLVPNAWNIADVSICGMTREEMLVFQDFMMKTLSWNPEERATARELRAHPFLNPSAYLSF